MKITVNGRDADIDSAMLSKALTELGYGDDCVATAVNEEFVQASSRDGFALRSGDRLEIVAPMQGG